MDRRCDGTVPPSYHRFLRGQCGDEFWITRSAHTISRRCLGGTLGYPVRTTWVRTASPSYDGMDGPRSHLDAVRGMICTPRLLAWQFDVRTGINRSHSVRSRHRIWPVIPAIPGNRPNSQHAAIPCNPDQRAVCTRPGRSRRSPRPDRVSRTRRSGSPPGRPSGVIRGSSAAAGSPRSPSPSTATRPPGSPAYPATSPATRSPRTARCAAGSG